MSRGVEKTALQAASLFGLILCVLTGIWAWQAGLLTSQERLQAFVASCGAAGGLLFVAFQMVQVVVPVLPGGLGCLVGVVLFGPVVDRSGSGRPDPGAGGCGAVQSFWHHGGSHDPHRSVPGV